MYGTMIRTKVFGKEKKKLELKKTRTKVVA
jgi:hypothetical protein